MGRQYERFAEVYDTMRADAFSLKMVEYTLRLFRHFGARPETGLDLCCGTGSAVEAFADSGLAMAGLDGSAAMLRAARRKLRHRKVTLYHQTLPRIDIREGRTGERRRFDFVSSYFDSLNYLLTRRDLQAAFRAVYRHLQDGGWFVFDMNTPQALKCLWDGQTVSGVRDNVAWVWSNEYYHKARRATVRATFFVKRDRQWQRFDEVHTEAAYPNAELRQMLRSAGFRIRGFYECRTFRKPDRHTSRICVVAQRPDQK